MILLNSKLFLKGALGLILGGQNGKSWKSAFLSSTLKNGLNFKFNLPYTSIFRDGLLPSIEYFYWSRIFRPPPTALSRCQDWFTTTGNRGISGPHQRTCPQPHTESLNYLHRLSRVNILFLGWIYTFTSVTFCKNLSGFLGNPDYRWPTMGHTSQRCRSMSAVSIQLRTEGQWGWQRHHTSLVSHGALPVCPSLGGLGRGLADISVGSVWTSQV